MVALGLLLDPVFARGDDLPPAALAVPLCWLRDRELEVDLTDVRRVVANAAAVVVRRAGRPAARREGRAGPLGV